MTDARIAERGYRRYDGPRFGPMHAVGSLLRQTVLRILGMHRPARTKALPFLSVAIAYLPAITFVGLIALLPGRLRTVVPAYSDYYGFVTAAITLFALFAAAEALCPDRRSRVLSLYLASPLTRATYLLAKAGAVFAVMLLVTLGPPLLLLLGLSLQGAGPGGPVAVGSVLVRILVSGVTLAAAYTAVSTAVSSLTDRRALAAGGTLLLLFGTDAVVSSLAFGAGVDHRILLLSLNHLPFELVQRVFGRAGDVAQASTALVAFTAVAFTVGGAAVAWWRYQRLQVTR